MRHALREKEVAVRDLPNSSLTARIASRFVYTQTMYQEGSIILIDGSNFYFKLKDLSLHHQLTLDFSQLMSFILRGRKLVYARYYVGAVRSDGTDKLNKLLADQQRLLSSLRKHHVSYSLGHLPQSDEVSHEKGADVNIAVDMLVAAYENKCDRIYLLSSDTDLIPAIQKAREKGKAVTYVGFSHSPSVALVAACTDSQLLTKEDLSGFIKPIPTKQKAA